MGRVYRYRRRSDPPGRRPRPERCRDAKRCRAAIPAAASDDTHRRTGHAGAPCNILADTDEDDTRSGAVARDDRGIGRAQQVAVPMLREGEPIGAITSSGPNRAAVHRSNNRAAADLCRPGRDRDRERAAVQRDQEALERQTATADILKVIASSPSDVQPVFEAIVDSAKRLLGGFSAAVFRFIDGMRSPGGLHADEPGSRRSHEEFIPAAGRPTVRRFDRSCEGGQIVHDSGYGSRCRTTIRDIARARGFRSMLVVPLMSSGTPIGIISCHAGTSRHRSPTITSQLLQTFADQAVIAIENVAAVQRSAGNAPTISAKSLQQQTAIGDVLKVISRFAVDLQPVLETLVEHARPCCATPRWRSYAS